MKKRLTSFVLVLALSFSLSVSAFAVDDNDYYSLPSVGASEPSVAMDWPVNPAEFDNGDSTTLTNIYKYIQYLTLSPSSWQSNSVIGFLEKIFDRIPKNLADNFGLQGLNRGTNVMLDEIAKWTMFSYNYLSSDNIAGNLGNISRNTLNTNDAVLKGNSFLSSISDKVATDSTLSGFDSFFRNVFFSGGQGSSSTATGHFFYPMYHAGLKEYRYLTWGDFMQNFFDAVSREGSIGNGATSLYTYVKNLSETLASEDDKQLAENYKDNRVQAEQDFLSGQSGKTSLGKGDFSNASQVGGALNDTFNMGGAAKVSDFLSGFGSAGTESQAWFSQTTSNNLNAVEASDGTQGVSTFSDDGQSMVDVDPDPYNMGGIFSRYDWLEGVDMDD